MTKSSSIGPTNNLDKREQHGEITRLKWKRPCKISFFHIQYLTFLSFILTSLFFYHAYHLPLSNLNPKPQTPPPTPPLCPFLLSSINSTSITIILNLRNKKAKRKCNMRICNVYKFIIPSFISPKKWFCNKWGYWNCQGYWRLWAFTIMRLLHCYLHLQGENQNDITLNVFLKYVYMHHISVNIIF